MSAENFKMSVKYSDSHGSEFELQLEDGHVKLNFTGDIEDFPETQLELVHSCVEQVIDGMAQHKEAAD